MLTTSLICCREKIILMNIFGKIEKMERFRKVQRNIIPEKEDFYRQLNMEDITHANNAHSKRVSKKVSKQ